MADELETDEYAAKYVKNWFRNNAIPPVLISGLGVGLPELQRLEEKWLAKYQRTGPGWLPHFLGKDVQVHQLSQSFQQQELGELRTMEKNTIRQVLGIPPEIMGDVTSSNRSTIDSADFIYQSRIIVPRAEFLRAAFQQFLIPMFDPRLIIDYINPVSEDREFALKVRQAAPYAWSFDEWRALGLSEPLPNGQGNVHALPFNIVLTGPNMATQAALDRLKPPAPAPAPTPGLAPAPSAAPKPPALPPASSGEAPAPSAGAPPPRMTPAQRADALRERIARVREEQVHKTLHQSEIAAILTAISPEYFEDHGSVILRSAIEKFGVSTLEEATGGAIDITFNMNDENVINFLKSWGGDRISMINDTTKEKIGETLADGVEAGETYDELVTRVGAVFDTREDQAENIATTELTRATGFASNEALSQGGFEEKEWLATDDDHVRDTHKDLDGTVVGVDEDFVSSSGASGPYPGELGDPAEDCNCRCQIITVLAERSAMMRAAQWKVLDAERRPFDRRLTSVFTAGLRLQREAVLDALKTAAKALEAA
jgi:SPP1 gp7 family putative phage head morphogenesis protein